MYFHKNAYESVAKGTICFEICVLLEHNYNISKPST